MRLNEYLDCNALQLAQRIKSKDVSVHEVLDCALARMHDVNPSLNAVVTDCSDVAKTCLTHLKGDEPYFGVPFLIKDLGHDLQGVRTTEGSRFFAQNIASVTSDLVAKLLMLGFVPIGKTNAAELGLSYVTESAFLGPCRNPYDLNRTPGGSSGGSASAVAAGIVPMATASDGGGSIRIPAACCGLVGFKPTTGVMPVGPWTNEAWSGLATSFVLARSLEDTSALFSTLASAHLAPVDAKQLTIVELEGAFAPVPVDPAYLDAVCHIKTVLTQLGHRIEKKQVHLDRDGIADCMLTLVAANTYMDIAIQEEKVGRRVKKDDIECATMEFYHRGKRLSANDYLLSKNRLYQLIRPLHQLLTPNDVILTPALAQPPLLIGELRTNGPFEEYLLKSTAFSPFTSLFNQAGLPAMTLPVMKHGHLPVSVQMAAAKGNDVLLFSLAKALQPMLPSMTRASYCLGDKGG